MALVMVYFGISYDRMPLMFTITRRNCHQYAANLIFVWYITCDNLEQSRIQFLFYIKLIVNNSGFLYCGGNKFQLMLILPDEFNKRTEFDWTVFEIFIKISSPNSCSNLFSELWFWNVELVCSFSCSVPTWENFELTQWPFLNYFVYLVKKY